MILFVFQFLEHLKRTSEKATRVQTKSGCCPSLCSTPEEAGNEIEEDQSTRSCLSWQRAHVPKVVEQIRPRIVSANRNRLNPCVSFLRCGFRFIVLIEHESYHRLSLTNLTLNFRDRRGGFKYLHACVLENLCPLEHNSCFSIRVRQIPRLVLCWRYQQNRQRWNPRSAMASATTVLASDIGRFPLAFALLLRTVRGMVCHGRTPP